MQISPLPASGFLRRPWKNGLGETILIAGDTRGQDWQDVEWSLSRTVIRQAGPFSDFTGYERWQVVIEGSGLVLETPDREIDLRQSLRPVRYDGAVSVRARLEAGEVGVVNLIARQCHFSASMRVLAAGGSLPLPRGLHVLFAPIGDSRPTLAGKGLTLKAGDGLRLESDTPFDLSNAGSPLILASIGALGHRDA